ncbi:hypothetical protein [Paenibacillus terrigena]|uniref:hypothetical protein n=1 Tax=Paenibacillus terrigena TaxID=369333 RepID=UPI001B7FE8FD|nr:hypothetical protein [Paenibacillus terrigena]
MSRSLFGNYTDVTGRPMSDDAAPEEIRAAVETAYLTFKATVFQALIIAHWLQQVGFLLFTNKK